MKKKTNLSYENYNFNPLFKDKETSLIKERNLNDTPLSEKDLNKHLKNINKMNKIFDELLESLKDINI